MKMVLVEWNDAFSDGGWRSPVDDLPVSNCITIGLLMYDNPEKVTIVQSKSDSGSYTDRISIPRGCIKRIRYLRIK